MEMMPTQTRNVARPRTMDSRVECSGDDEAAEDVVPEMMTVGVVVTVTTSPPRFAAVYVGVVSVPQY